MSRARDPHRSRRWHLRSSLTHVGVRSLRCSVPRLRSARLTGAEGATVDCGVVPLLPAVIVFDFDPVLSVGGLNVRWETIGVAVAAFAALLIAGMIARTTPVDLARPPDAPGKEPGEQNHLRRDDLLYIAVAAIPGAVVGGRLGYVLTHLDYYRANPVAMTAIGQGGFELALAVEVEVREHVAQP